jgi:hypothetical protein
MRIWHPIPPLCLDDKRLLAEHRELHAIWNVLTLGKSGYRNHPETKRWEGHLPALARRHNQLVAEMERRGWTRHRTPLLMTYLQITVWPEPIEPVEDMRTKLCAKLLAARMKTVRYERRENRDGYYVYEGDVLRGRVRRYGKDWQLQHERFYGTYFRCDGDLLFPTRRQCTAKLLELSTAS